ncbi:MAG: FliM/FliN family flagellar motor switch protein [Nitratireductor sp.]
MGFRVGEKLFEIETVFGDQTISPSGQTVVIEGSFGAEPFLVHVAAPALIAMLQAVDPAITNLPSMPVDALLACEAIASNLISRIEEATGEMIALHSLSLLRAGNRVSSGMLGASIASGGNQWPAGFEVGPRAASWLEGYAAANQHPAEKRISRQMAVCIGPVAMATEQVYRARPGAIVDCGVDPSADVRGILLRSDGSYWPISIEDEVIEVTGSLRGPVPMRAGTGSTIVSMRIGDVTLTPSERLRIEPGTRILVSRIPENLAELRVGSKALCHGELDVVEGTLAVRISATGAIA